MRPFDTSSATGTSATKSAAVAGKWMVSKDGGTNALWRHDRKELLFLSQDGAAIAMDVSTSGVFQRDAKPLFKVPPGVLFWDVSPDREAVSNGCSFEW